MTLERLRLVDIADKEEELLVQEIINDKVRVAPPTGDIYRGDVPDIKTPEEEAKWQKEMDARAEATIPSQVDLPQQGEVHVPTDEEREEQEDSEDDEEEEEAQEEDPPTIPDNNPNDLPPPNDPPVTAKKKFCDFCDSKGGSHKKECPTRKVNK